MCSFIGWVYFVVVASRTVTYKFGSSSGIDDGVAFISWFCVTGQGPLTTARDYTPHFQSFDVFFVVCLSKMLNKQWSFPKFAEIIHPTEIWAQASVRLPRGAVQKVCERVYPTPADGDYYGCNKSQYKATITYSGYVVEIMPLQTKRWVYLITITGAVIMESCLRYKSLKLIWRSDTNIFRPRVLEILSTGQDIMMTSSNGNIFRVTGHLCGEFAGPRWIPRTKASDAELWCFLWSVPEQTVE